jgi:hypothetical protein
MMRPSRPWRKADHQAAGRAIVGSVIVGFRQVTVAGAPARLLAPEDGASGRLTVGGRGAYTPRYRRRAQRR